ncbi:cobalt transport protein ATP-binding subunit [Desulfosporosinus acidiphilus SJ4]|uniref:ABC transporter ATP-binding protein n=1 Tax=Desulfosporosinus acidiphilus (strain DSM 22704 / JCM 16185 / SJ4) TaxID=646529 RepID=I4D415_DESAJ|nr:ATP-binding cassette domain-containing protein [Desulfosporosinus acidiphilus]AFM40539.1 cobalt transport protein ATP-binding subunit [Desulfosporosinus acidiphilus SJ4]
MELIKASGVSYTYNDGNQALNNINLKVMKGERIAILGPNGAGKSTLFQLFNGLLLSTSGTVTIKDLPVQKENFPEIRRTIGMVFQDPDDQLFNSSVRQEIAYGLMNMHVSGQALENAIAWALEVVGMQGYENKSPHNLSGGEKKRIALASVLAMKPEVLVLDEPTAALDPRGVSKLIGLLNAINKDLGITLIFATHDVDIVPLLADRVYLLSKGEIILEGTTAEVFNHKEIIRGIDLRLPRVAHLAELLARDGKLSISDLPLTIGQAKSLLGNLCR